MSSFDTLESGIEISRPIEIYSFAMGSTTWTYTSWSQDVTVNSIDYVAIPIKRSRIVQATDQKTRNTTVTVPSENQFAAQYINVSPGEKVTLTIIRLQPDESPTFDTQVLLFKGTVQAVSYPRDGYTAEIVVRSIEAAKNQILPRVTYMGMCSHSLYDLGCGVDQGLFNITGPTAAGGTTAEITVTGANAEADGYWTGGYVTALSGTQDFRFIVKHVGNVLTLMLPFAADVSGLTMQVFAGCDHIATGDCKTKFENVLEFGGFPFVPKKNIFQSGL
jgi:uncharacterized phage protein (TIGR02218 family)